MSTAQGREAHPSQAAGAWHRAEKRQRARSSSERSALVRGGLTGAAGGQQRGQQGQGQQRHGGAGLGWAGSAAPSAGPYLTSQFIASGVWAESPRRKKRGISPGSSRPAWPRAGVRVRDGPWAVRGRAGLRPAPGSAAAPRYPFHS